MRYIVFGGSGFVGYWAIKALQEAISLSRIKNGEIICLDIQKPKNDNIHFVAVDISRDFTFPFKKSDIVIHLAARAYAPKPPIKAFSPHCLKDYFFSVNVDGTKRIIHQMLESQCQNLIYFSTDMVYGVPLYLPLDTSHQRNPIGYYGLSKKISEDFIIANRATSKDKNANIANYDKITNGGGGLTLRFSAHE